jgi:NAD+ kinase
VRQVPFLRVDYAPIINVIFIDKKTTAWELHQAWYEDQLRLGFMPQWDFDRIKQAHDDHHQAVDLLEQELTKAKIFYRIVCIDHNDWQIDGQSKVIVTVGGDGTLLSASHRVPDETVTIYGLRSSGTSVGYLCAGGIDKIPKLISSIQENKFRVVLASRLGASIFRAGETSPIETPPALNDFLFSNANPAATTRYRITLGDRTEEHKSSGMWFSTALGSTASVSAAGGVIQPRTDVNFQYIVRELYRAAGKNFYLINGFFDPEIKQMIIENRSESAILAADGNHGICKVNWGDRIVFKRARSVNIAY